MSSLRNEFDPLIPEFEESDLIYSNSSESEQTKKHEVECVFTKQLADVVVESPPKVSCSGKQNPSIGQKVVISRKCGQKQEAIVTNIVYNTNNHPGQQISNSIVDVEWVDSDGFIKGKTVDISTLNFNYNDLLPKHPTTTTSTTKQPPKNADCRYFNNQPGPSSTSNNNDSENNVVNNNTPASFNAKSNNISNNDLTSVCAICGLSFKNERGLKTHIVKKHPIEANTAKLNSILKTSKQSEKPINSSTKNEIDKWDETFKNILTSKESFNPEIFDQATKDFVHFLREANINVPGPKHPSQRYYKIRKENKATKGGKGAGKVSNPQRSNKADRERRHEQYQYEVAQYYYYNRRKKVVQKVMTADTPKQCPIKITDLESHYRNMFEQTNDNCRQDYEQTVSQENIININVKSVHKAIKSTSLDTAPGPDGVLIRTVKHLQVAHIIKSIIDIFLKYAYIPEVLRIGRTVLIYKGKGRSDDISSWRPITMYSILRRLVEKVLDAELRQQVTFHSCQRGFVKGLAGCHVNSRLIDAVLKDAKTNKKDAAVAFLDVTGAFDNAGHLHIIKTLRSRGASENLINCIEALLCQNQVKIRAGNHDTSLISVKRGVPQGGPLSATLFNLAIDHIYREFCDPQFTNQYGYSLNQELENILLSGFADDQAITASSPMAAVRVINSICRKFREIGLVINPSKSTCILISKGEHYKNKLILEDDSFINSNNADEVIKYLGCSFTGEMVYNENSVEKLNENMNKLVTSNLLKPDQKLNILNQYIFPTLTYPLQTAPLTKLRPAFLEGVDVIIRRCTKAIVGLPANSSTAMLYAPRRYRGLGILRCLWEAPLQHISILQKLKNINDVQFQSILDYDVEISDCLDRVGLNLQNFGDKYTAKKIRQSLRENAFEEWCKCKWQGIGVCHFKDNGKSNEFISNRQILTGSEWTNAIKLNINYAPLRGVPTSGAQTTGELGRLCRKCSRETETPAHVLGNCPNNMLLVTRRHHNVKHKIIDLMKQKGYTCYEEVYSIDSNGSTRYADIIAFKDNSEDALVIDPTVRYESNDVQQGEKVHLEKKAIYDKCLNYYREKFLEKHGLRDFYVKGLWFGTRGAIPKITSDFFNEIGIDKKELARIAESIILDSLGILNHHIYG